ncbi:MAG: VanZ family protein [Phycisphaerales bacterium]|nr:VanZ family protein [Phycisphaerales bacterium]
MNAPAPAPSALRRRADGGHLETVLVVVVVGLIALASLAPFRFDANRLMQGLREGVLGWPKWKWSDAIVNLLAYVPVGTVGALWLRRRARTVFTLLGAVLAGAALSFLLETLQAGIVTRWPSWCDFALNTLGSLAGAALAVEFAPGIGGFVRTLARKCVLREVRFSRWVALSAWSAVLLAASVDGVAAAVQALARHAGIKFHSLPMWDYLHEPELHVLQHVLAHGAVLVLLGFITVTIGQSIRLRERLTLGAAAILGVLAAGVSAAGVASSSDLLVGLAAAWIGASAARRWFAVLRIERADAAARRGEAPVDLLRQGVQARRRAFNERAPQPVTPSPHLGWTQRSSAARAGSR